MTLLASAAPEEWYRRFIVAQRPPGDAR